MGEFYWYFQAFNIQNRRPPHRREVSPYLRRYTQEGGIRNFLSERPLKRSRGDFVEASRETFGDDPSVARQARLRTPKEMVLQLTEMGFGELFSELQLDYSGLEE